MKHFYSALPVYLRLKSISHMAPVVFTAFLKMIEKTERLT